LFSSAHPLKSERTARPLNPRRWISGQKIGRECFTTRARQANFGPRILFREIPYQIIQGELQISCCSNRKLCRSDFLASSLAAKARKPGTITPVNARQVVILTRWFRKFTTLSQAERCFVSQASGKRYSQLDLRLLSLARTSRLRDGRYVAVAHIHGGHNVLEKGVNTDLNGAVSVRPLLDHCPSSCPSYASSSSYDPFSSFHSCPPPSSFAFARAWPCVARRAW